MEMENLDLNGNLDDWDGVEVDFQKHRNVGWIGMTTALVTGRVD